jgi:5-methyltetrahydropteroyltriglutamate--homocysteine methyltransferase
MNPTTGPRILTTTVGSYPIPDWLVALPSEQALIDAIRVVFDIQRQAGIDLPTDGELYRFDINHPETNGMIEYFIHRFGGIRSSVGREDVAAFRAKAEMRYRTKPSAVVTGPLAEGTLNLPEDSVRAAYIARGPFKFTVTSPYMLARTLLDHHYDDFRKLTLEIAGILARQVADLSCACVQVDEANVPGNPLTLLSLLKPSTRCSMRRASRRLCTSVSVITEARQSKKDTGARLSHFSMNCGLIISFSRLRIAPVPISMHCRG